MTKLTQEDAQDAIRGNFPRLLEEKCPVEWRIKRWKSLANGKMIKAFNAQGEIIYSKRLADNTTRLRALENISKMAGDFPAAGVDLRLPEGMGGKWVIEVVDPKNTVQDDRP